MVTYRNGCCSHPRGNTCKETAHMEHPQVLGSSQQHVAETHTVVNLKKDEKCMCTHKHNDPNDMLCFYCSVFTFKYTMASMAISLFRTENVEYY